MGNNILCNNTLNFINKTVLLTIFMYGVDILPELEMHLAFDVQ